MTKKLCALSVDLDPLSAYYQIHGLGETPTSLRHTILRKALPRFEELFAEAGVPATFFVVAADVQEWDDSHAMLRRLVEAGHELGNHTFSHPYALCRLPENTIDEEIGKAHDLLSRIAGEGREPKGFRTPGYWINGQVMQSLIKRNYVYDSSMFPSPPYYVAKAMVMAAMAVRGRTSGAVIGDPRGLLCPADPYRPALCSPWKRGNAPIIEMPVAVLPWTKVPAIGTLLAVGPLKLRRYMLSAIKQRSFFNLELHGIDLADAIADRIPTELAGRQADLRVPFVEKRQIFLQTINELKAEYEFVTLSQAAEHYREALAHD